MNRDEHDIGKILGCIVFALGSRELLTVVHRLIVGSAMFHIPLFEMLLVPKQASFFRLRCSGVGGFFRIQFPRSGRVAG